MPALSDDELLEALGVGANAAPPPERSAREERFIAGFLEIQRFVADHGREPRLTATADIFERVYAVRLERIRSLEFARKLLADLDVQGLLTPPTDATQTAALSDDDLLGALSTGEGDISELRHVRSAERRAADEIASRVPCANFEEFAPLFEQVKSDLASGLRETRSFSTRAMDEIRPSTFFIVGGQIAYVAQASEEFTTEYDRRDSRVRVIYDNGTESTVLQRSLQRALHRDEAARYIPPLDLGPLFGDTWAPDDVESGTVYVLRSKSKHPFVLAHRDLIHKIGITSGKVEDRIVNAENDSTYLLAGVEVVATYKLSGINRVKLERLFHRLFSSCQVDITIEDRFGKPVRPREWFLVPLHVIDEAVRRVRDGTITRVVYEVESAQLVERA